MLYEVLSRANHSCAPNLTIDFEAGLVVAVSTLCDVTAGEELCLGYIAAEMGETTSRRQQVLLARYNFECACERCGPRLPPSPRIDALETAAPSRAHGRAALSGLETRDTASVPAPPRGATAGARPTQRNARCKN